MTLSDYTDFVCTTLNRTDSDSRDACKIYANARYKMVYDAYPWRDSMVVSDPIDPQSDESPEQTYLTQIGYPTGVERVVKVALVTSTGPERVINDLRPTDSARLIETRPDALLQRGVPEFYEEIITDAGRKIRIHPSQDSSIYRYLVVGKRTFTDLVNDSDAPILRNVDNAIIAFTTADMLKRDRNYAKAAQQLQEAQAILQEAIQLEQNQSNAPRAARPLSVTGGTLSELTDAVSSRLQLWDADSQNRIQDAIRRSYQHIYDRALWPESVVILRMQAQLDILVLPSFIERVIGVNSEITEGTLDIRELEYLFRLDPQLIDQQGTPMMFNPLPPVAVSVLPELSEQLAFQSSSSDDYYSIYLYGEADGVIRKETVSLSSGSGTSSYEYDTPLVISKPKSLGTLTVSGASSLIKFEEIPAEVSSQQHQRLWVQPTNPDSLNTTYLILGKRRLQQLIDANDAVAVRGCENALIKMACGEIAQADQAAMFKSDAEKEIQMLIDKETNQNSRRATVTPYTDRWNSAGLDDDGFLRG